MLFPSISLKGCRPWRALRAYRPAIVATLLRNARPRADDYCLLRGRFAPLPKWALPPWNPHTRRREARGAGQARLRRLTPHPEPRLGHSSGFKGFRGISSPLWGSGIPRPLSPDPFQFQLSTRLKLPNRICISIYINSSCVIVFSTDLAPGSRGRLSMWVVYRGNT